MFELRKPREAKLMSKPDDCIGSDEEPFSNALKRDIVNIIAQLDDVAHDLAFEIVELALASSHMIIKRFLIFHKMFQPLVPRRIWYRFVLPGEKSVIGQDCLLPMNWANVRVCLHISVL